MGLLSKLKKIHKKLDPIGNKIHEKTGGKIEKKLEGKTPLGKIVDAKKPSAGRVTGGAAKPAVAPTKPMQVSSSPLGGIKKPALAGGFNKSGAARLNRLVGSKKLSRK